MEKNYVIAMGLCVGVLIASAIGFVTGTAFHTHNAAVLLPIGAGMGLALGAAFGIVKYKSQ